MNYETFRSWREAVLRTKTPHRLDCMNPEVALAHLRPTHPVTDPRKADDPFDAWSIAVGFTVAADRQILGSGVRAILEGLFGVVKDRIDSVWLPSDVYPVYWQLSATLRRRPFLTLPEVDWGFLDQTGPRDIVLLPHPLSPLGRPLSASELNRLVEWLNAAPTRMLILDAVYLVAKPFDQELRELLNTGRLAMVWSLSKSWLSRGLLGMATVPVVLRDELQKQVAVPEPAVLSRVAAMLAHAPDFPFRLADRFSAAWSQLAPSIRAVCPAWRPPETGYFSIVEANFEKLLAAHDLLTVPASVFGSARTDLSVVTCLHHMESIERGART
jgi:histidinol-phosphate/aromatic aminotransferase/cobyric acid decarboxylase-like protein